MEIESLSGHPFEICSISNLYSNDEIDSYIKLIDDISTKENCFNTRDIYKKIMCVVNNVFFLPAYNPVE